jgi:hypothetical protein
MTPFVAGQNVELKYKFFDGYVDQCHPNNPSCVTGVTCTNCADGFNPVLDVACNLVVFSNNPVMTGVDNQRTPPSRYSVRPNPAGASAEVYAFGSPAVQVLPIQMLTITGTIVGQFEWDGKSLRLDLSQYPRGVYILKIGTPDRTEIKKLVLQ